MKPKFDGYAAQYDAWFMENENLFQSELRLFQKALAFRDSHIQDVTNMEELGEAVQHGFARAMWCGDDACELEVKNRFNAKTRNMPFDQTPIGDTCVVCGKKATKLIYFGKQY